MPERGRRPDHDTRCPTCGGSAHALDATARAAFGGREFVPKGPRKALDLAWDESDKLANELDSTYAHLRAVISLCEGADVAAIRHRLVGLLPEVQPPSSELRERLPDLAARRDATVREAWAEYGYEGPTEAE